MMDTATEELLSRLLDGDVPDTEAAELERRFKQEPELLEAYDRMAAIRSAVSSLADSMEPPAELDSLMEPLRRSRPSPRGMRRAYGWLAAAATAVIGLSVALEVHRRNPEPSTDHAVATRRPLPTQRPRGEYFQLQPLPTAVPGKELLGATDHLLAEPAPSPPPVAEPEALQVIGPLSEGEFAEIARSPFVNEAELPDDSVVAAREEITFAPEPPAAPGEARARKSAGALRSQTIFRQMEAEEQRSRCVLLVRAGGRVIRLECPFEPDVAPGRYDVVLGIDGGTIASCQVLNENDRSRAAAICSPVSGLHLAGIGDGEIRGELIVGGGE